MAATVPELANRRIGGPCLPGRWTEHLQAPGVHTAIILPVARGIGEDKMTILVAALSAINVAWAELLVEQADELLIAEIRQPAGDLIGVELWFSHGSSPDLNAG
jgi:hypothetical protein